MRKEDRDTSGNFKRSAAWEEGKRREGKGLGNSGIFG
jgi:hypothetical protein